MCCMSLPRLCYKIIHYCLVAITLFIIRAYWLVPTDSNLTSVVGYGPKLSVSGEQYHLLMMIGWLLVGPFSL